VDAGAQARVPTAVSSAPLVPAVTLVSPAALASALAWRERRVEFAETPLGETLAWFNRQNALQLSLATPALAQRRISGVYWSDDPEGFVRLLETSLSVRAERVGDTLVLRTR
jgi:transmembrane sensor